MFTSVDTKRTFYLQREHHVGQSKGIFNSPLCWSLNVGRLDPMGTVN